MSGWPCSGIMMVVWKERTANSYIVPNSLVVVSLYDALSPGSVFFFEVRNSLGAFITDLIYCCSDR